MDILSFYCPTTAKSIDTAIETQHGKLAGSRAKTLRVRCPHCGEVHVLVLPDAFTVEKPRAELSADEEIALAERMTQIPPRQRTAKA